MIVAFGWCGLTTRNGRYVLMSASSESRPSWTARIIATPVKGLVMEPMYMTVCGVKGRVRCVVREAVPLHPHDLAIHDHGGARRPMMPASAMRARDEAVEGRIRLRQRLGLRGAATIVDSAASTNALDMWASIETLTAPPLFDNRRS